MAIVDALGKLSATEFENLVFDLCTEVGLRNAVWRTPGPDGGRDIEGDIPITDFSGQSVSQRWFVECKRYERTIPWPTVWKKIAHADNQGADYLLLATTSAPSPACWTEISTWNSDGRSPSLRVWEGQALERMLLQYPAVLSKYGLPGASEHQQRSFSQLAAESAKAIQAAYGIGVIREDVHASLEAAAALAELLTSRMAGMVDGRRFKAVPFDPTSDSYPWLDCPDEARQFDRQGLRAILAFLRHVASLDRMSLHGEDNELFLRENEVGALESPALKVLEHLAMWSDCEVRRVGNELVLRGRSYTDVR